MRIAKFKRLGEESFEMIAEEGTFMERHPAYIRLTEYAEVDFKPLRSEEVVQKQLDSLAKAEQALRNKFQTAMNSIEQQRANLLALAYFPAE